MKIYATTAATPTAAAIRQMSHMMNSEGECVDVRP